MSPTRLRSLRRGEHGDGYRTARSVTLFCWRLRFRFRVVGTRRSLESAAFEQWLDVRIASDEIFK
jgi:hypothetical protein